MGDRCEGCGREKAATGHEWNIDFQSARSDEVADTCGAHLSSIWSDESLPDCERASVRWLRAKLTRLEALVEAQAKVIAAAQTVVISATLCASPSCKFGLDGYDAVKAELEKVR